MVRKMGRLRTHPATKPTLIPHSTQTPISPPAATPNTHITQHASIVHSSQRARGILSEAERSRRICGAKCTLRSNHLTRPVPYLPREIRGPWSLLDGWRSA